MVHYLFARSKDERKRETNIKNVAKPCIKRTRNNERNNERRKEKERKKERKKEIKNN